MTTDPNKIKQLLGLAIHQALNVRPDKDPRRDLQSGEKLWIRAAGPMVDYLYASGSIGDDLNHQILELYAYVDTTSGSIGQDLNNQVHNVRLYTDTEINTVSGSIGQDLNNQVLELYEYVDTQITTVDTLDEVVKNGSYTNHGIQVDASGSSFYNLDITSGSIDMSLNTIVNVLDPINAQDAATKNYVDTISGSIGDDLNNQIWKVRLYTDDEIDTVSGSIGVDLNHQVSNLKAYTDTVSGSIGYNLETNYATKNYVDTVSGSIGSNLETNYATKNYVDTVSGSIGDDLNHQISNVRAYTDTVSGSIGQDLNHQVLELYSYVDTVSGSGAQSLQSVTNIGNTTTKDITAANLKSNANIYINNDGPGVDSYLYFYENDSATGASLMWDDDPGEFVFSHQLSMSIHKIVDVVDPTNAQDAVTLNYLEGIVSGSSHDYTLDDVCENGAITDVAITVQASGSTFSTLTVYDDIQIDDEALIGGTARITGTSENYTNAGWGKALEFENADVLMWKKGGGTYSFGMGLSSDNLYLFKSTADDASAAPTYIMTIEGAANIVSYTGRLRTGSHLSINYDGPDGDSFIYFYDNSSEIGQLFKWDDADGVFELSTDLRIYGNLRSNDNVYINYGGGDGDSYLYFYEGGSNTGASLMFDDNPGEFVFSHQLSMNTHKIVDVVDPVDNQDAATKNYVDTVSGSIGSNLETNYATKNYVDTVSGSIGQDLNHQVHDVRLYTDTVSGSIGNDLNHQVLELYSYVDTVSGSAGTLQSVTDNGNITDQPIISTTSGSWFKDTAINGDLTVYGESTYLNANGPDGDQYLYFYENGNPAGAYIIWSHSNSYFYFSDQIYVAGNMIGQVKSIDNIHVNYDGGEGDSYLYFYDGGSETGASLMWDDDPGNFKFSHGIEVESLEINQTPISGSITPTVYITLTVQQAGGQNRTIRIAGEMV